MNAKKRIRTKMSVLLIILACGMVSAALAAEGKRWEHEKMDLRMTGRGRIKGIRYPKGKKPLLLKERRQRPRTSAADTGTATSATTTKSLTTPLAGSVSVSVIDSPPIDGFVPWIVVGTSDARAGSDDIDFEAHPAARQWQTEPIIVGGGSV